MHSPYLLIGLAALTITATDAKPITGHHARHRHAARSASPFDGEGHGHLPHPIDGSLDTHPGFPHEEGSQEPASEGDGGIREGHWDEWSAAAHATHHHDWTASANWIYATESAALHDPDWASSSNAWAHSEGPMTEQGEHPSETTAAVDVSSLGGMVPLPSSGADDGTLNSQISAVAASPFAPGSQETSASAAPEVHESLYIVPNHGTDMYDKATAPQAWTTPPCTTTVTSVTATPSCITPTYERKYQSSVTLPAAAEPTSNLLRRLTNLFGLKRSLAQPELAPATAPKFEKRAFVLQPGEGSIPAGREEPNPVRQYAMGLGAGNFDTAVRDSIAAVLSPAGVASLWLKLESKGNPYKIFYLNNGHGLPAVAIANEVAANAIKTVGASAVASTVTSAAGIVGSLVQTAASSVSGAVSAAPVSSPPPVGDAAPALLSMLGQVNGKTYSIPLATKSVASAATSSASVSSIKATSANAAVKIVASSSSMGSSTKLPSASSSNTKPTSKASTQSTTSKSSTKSVALSSSPKSVTPTSLKATSK